MRAIATYVRCAWRLETDDTRLLESKPPDWSFPYGLDWKARWELPEEGTKREDDTREQWTLVVNPNSEQPVWIERDRDFGGPIPEESQ